MTKITVILREDLCSVILIPRWIIFGMRYISGRSRRENQNTHFMFSYFFREPCVLWDNVEEYDRAPTLMLQCFFYC